MGGTGGNASSGGPGCPGADGSQGTGGAGGTGSNCPIGGGGGGGGLYGGGGGGAGTGGSGNGGGGGGSSLVPSGGSESTDTSGTPEVVISYATPAADVSVAISGPTSAKSGSTNTYLVTVANAGPGIASNVVLTDAVPAGTKFQSVSTTQGSCTHPAAGATSGTITCSVGDMAPSSNSLTSLTLKITLRGGKGGNITDVAQAYSTASGTTTATPDPNLANNTASINTTVTK
jgi:uncharacterized repeat protein (TIGR01451 family)